MNLLVQMWRPFKSSPMDRPLYTWGCGQVGCQGNDRSGIRTNEAYAQREWDHATAEECPRREKQRKEMLGDGNPAHGSKSASATPAFGAVPGIVDAQILGEVAAPANLPPGFNPAKGNGKDDQDDENARLRWAMTVNQPSRVHLAAF
ncbi:hypothetical protein D9619_013452 [Psilocybe cf. subviscida]|uniref:Uncharacterized protein n=1 Tax=Psilocybe cf. subviscida TaxID=2480587 RepID=A0A8H5BTA3_9AGAR|nr:hypothetical protein D9619_013452 [Psilocybe cf. subviscida]